MNLNRGFSHVQEPKSKSSDNHIINKLQEMFKEINWIVRDTIDAINDVYKKYQLRYSVNQHQDILLRILTPLQIKGYIDKRQAYLLFQNKNDAYNLFSGLKANNEHSYSYPTSKEIEYKKNRNTILKQQKDIIRYTQPKQQKIQEYYQADPNQSLNSQLLRNKLRGEYEQSKNRYDLNEEDILKYQPKMKERKPGVRSRGVQDHLCNWIIQESKRRPVGRVDVINKAKQFGKNRNLKASVGWYSNFIRRNPEIRMILTRGNLVKKNIEVKKYPDQERKIEEQSQSMQGMMGIYDQQDQMEDENIKNEDSDNEDYDYSYEESNSQFDPINPNANVNKATQNVKDVKDGKDGKDAKDVKEQPNETIIIHKPKEK